MKEESESKLESSEISNREYCSLYGKMGYFRIDI